MILKAYITEIPSEDNLYKVRIPYLEDNTSTQMIFSATLCNTPGVYGGFDVGDCVYVSFEGNKYSQENPTSPVIIGKLFIDTNDDVNTYQVINNLKIKNKVELPANTKIGDYNAYDIFTLYQATSVSLDNKSGSGLLYNTIGDVLDKDYLCFTALTDSTITLSATGSPDWDISYSGEDGNWTEYTPNTTGAITILADQSVYFKGIQNSNNSSSDYLTFSMTGSVMSSGDVMSLCLGDDFEESTTIPYTYSFYKLFNGCQVLKTSPVISALTLKEHCYQSMFSGCTSLRVSPELPATTLATDCYAEMFSGCTSLQVNDASVSGTAEQAWTIPASGTFTNTYSQSDMFANCAGTRSSDDMAGATGNSYTYYTQGTLV